MKHKLLVLFIGLSVLGKLNAQDMQFTQFYAVATYLNPAFTGANACSRLSTTYRNQWPSIPRGYVSYALSYDHYLIDYNSGIGALITQDRAGTGQLRTTSYSLLYAYEIRLTRKIGFRAGFQATGSSRTVNFHDLTFGDQLARDGAAVSVETPSLGNVLYFDVSTGGLIYSKKYWLGFSGHHLNQPNQSLIKGESPLPVKYSVHGGAKILLPNNKGLDGKGEQAIFPAINYKAQNKFDQVDVGMYYENSPLIIGFWYRGIPVLKAYKEGYSNNDALSVLAGFTVERLRFGYSYDLTVSKLARSTGGAHEVSVIYQFCTLKKKKSRKKLVVPCPKF
jgi:type IX secretion system PorP/SprF family membrane protein